MLISEIRDLFVAQYKIQSQVRDLKQIEIPEKLLGSFISQAQQDIQRRLLVVESSVDITLSTLSNVHSLPSNFGLHKHAYVGQNLLDEKSARFIREQIAQGNSGYWYAIYQQGNTQQILTPLTSGTLTLFYYPDFRYYQPSVSASQDWGTFSGTVFSGKLLLPDRYDMAILYYMLSQVIPDYYQLYEKEIRSLRSSRVASFDDGFSYQFGGVENDVKLLTTGINANSSTSTVPTDTADKRSRIRIADTGDYTIESETGWDANPTVVNSVSSIVITSSASEFTNWLHVTCNQAFSWTLTGADTITITPSPASGWGEAEVIIEVWD
ncbi:MAG: hypothetical protein JETCAE03_35600 [Ignavibacteriaceae bacterium]|nr:MAG: hypothetical protein JETCAE03_35600 [Ignavibacteriaceae bacterium]